jgi:hypothetical protein
MRRSVIHSSTVRPVLRRTTVVRCPGVRPTARATSLSEWVCENLTGLGSAACGADSLTAVFFLP